MLTGQNGILNRAQEAKEKTEIANQDEADKLSSLEAMVQTPGKSIPNPSSYGENPNAQATADGAGKYFALPDGAKYLEGTVDTGVVVEIKGSEFVWVPVDDVVLDTGKTSELPINADNGTTNGTTYTPMAVKVGNDYKGLLYDFDGGTSFLKYNDSTNNYIGGDSDYREPAVASAYDNTNNDTSDGKITIEKLTSSYNSMIASVLKYKGFYVARYEVGIDNSSKNVVFKNADIEANNVTTSDASNANTFGWYKLYQKINEFTTNDDKVVSSMIWGSQYDAMMNWMLKTGNDISVFNDSKINNQHVTGQNKNDVVNNIYDLYACHYEWTLETYGNEHRSMRGGRANDSTYKNSPAHRTYTFLGNFSVDLSSRATIYIK